MIQVRKGVFETNSSSTHSLAIFSDEDWKKICKNEGYVNRYASGKSKVYTKEEVIDELLSENKSYRPSYTKEELLTMSEEEFLDIIESYDFVTSDYCPEYLEEDSYTYTTESGEVIHIRCQYGYDG